jgi:excisionase family DNA binding protein
MADVTKVSWTQQDTARRLGISVRTLIRWRHDGIHYGAFLEKADHQLLPVTKVAAMLNVSRSTVYRWFNEGLITGIKVNRTIRVQVDSVNRLLMTYAPKLPLIVGGQ